MIPKSTNGHGVSRFLTSIVALKGKSCGLGSTFVFLTVYCVAVSMTGGRVKAEAEGRVCSDGSRGGAWDLPPPVLYDLILLHEKFLQFDWLRAVVFQLNLKYLHVKITTLLWIVV